MGVITAESLMSLEQYAKARKEFRARVIAHKKPRTVRLGDHVTLVFEDELTDETKIKRRDPDIMCSLRCLSKSM